MVSVLVLPQYKTLTWPQEQELELHYLKEEREVAYKDINDLEDELADSRIMVRSRDVTSCHVV